MSHAHDEPRASAVPEPIAWYEGMLLWPQHFQQLARRQEALTHFHARTMGPYHWGVRVLKFDTIQPVRGILRVLELEAVLPDGLVVSHVAGQGRPDLDLNLTPFLDDLKQRSLTVHLAVVRHGEAGSGANGVMERSEPYEAPPVLDETSGEASPSVRRTRPRLHLLLGDDVPKKYVSLPLAQLRYRNEDYVRTDYVPPRLHVERAAPLGQICDEVCRMLRDKAAFLADRVDPKVKKVTPKVLFERHRIHSLIGGLGGLEALLHTDRAHPFALYAALCQVATHVAAVGHALVPPTFQPYRHDDLYHRFNDVKAYIDRCIEEGIDETHEVYVFDRQEEGFTLLFDEAWLDQKLVLGIRARASLDAVQWGSDCVICSATHLDDIRRRRVRGLDREHAEESDGLVPGRDMELFELKPDARVLVPGEPLVVMASEERPGHERPVEVLLYVRKERKREYLYLHEER